VIYVGVREHRPFTGRETARLELLGEQLTLHLDNAALVQRLEANIAALQDERGLRERFVSVLAHDLRGPLSTAKMAAQLLSAVSARVDARDIDLLQRVDRNLDRMDRMVRDLLDANRIHAGEKLPLALAQCDLVRIARDIIDDVASVHGNRFFLAGDASVSGNWDADQLRRALWNLCVNAAKYGASGAPIMVAVYAESDHAELSVQNEGPPIPREEQDVLFRPYVRSAGPGAARERGWGLGLTLVRGAAEAHGGRAYVESDPATGTTFTIELPYDAARAMTAT
jgi:signal transduction histidine kinase